MRRSCASIWCWEPIVLLYDGLLVGFVSSCPGPSEWMVLSVGAGAALGTSTRNSVVLLPSCRVGGPAVSWVNCTVSKCTGPSPASSVFTCKMRGYVRACLYLRYREDAYIEPSGFEV